MIYHRNSIPWYSYVINFILSSIRSYCLLLAATYMRVVSMDDEFGCLALADVG